MKEYTPIENAFYWIVTTAIVAIGITTLMLTFALVEYIFALKKRFGTTPRIKHSNIGVTNFIDYGKT